MFDEASHHASLKNVALLLLQMRTVYTWRQNGESQVLHIMQMVSCVCRETFPKLSLASPCNNFLPFRISDPVTRKLLDFTQRQYMASKLELQVYHVVISVWASDFSFPCLEAGTLRQPYLPLHILMLPWCMSCLLPILLPQTCAHDKSIATCNMRHCTLLSLLILPLALFGKAIVLSATEQDSRFILDRSSNMASSA